MKKAPPSSARNGSQPRYKRPGPPKPPAADWRTTDEDEIRRRQERAAEELHKITNTDSAHPVFSNFRVDSPSGRQYSVEIRDLETRQFHCTCTDFLINGLGSCKHVEAVLTAIPRRKRADYQIAKRLGSSRVDILPRSGTDRLVVERGLKSLNRRDRALFDEAGVLRPEVELETALQQLRTSSDPNVRLSQEVEPWLRSRTLARDRILARREYESQVAKGIAPESETKAVLFPYQRDGMLHLAFQERALLADEMGLGKTIQAIAACALLHRIGRARRALIVTPASLKAEWEEQIHRFVDLSLQLVFGTRRIRLEHYSRPDAPFFTIVNYEQVLSDSLEINAHLRPDIVILDEAQRIKNWATKTAQAVKRLESRYAFVLTGTPIENRLDELHSIVNFLDPALLGPHFRFNRQYYIFDEKGRPEGYRALEELRARVKPILLRRRKADVETELPSRTDRNLFVAMTLRQRDEYNGHAQTVLKLIQTAKRRPLTKDEQDKLMINLAMMRMICDTAGILSKKDEDCPKLDEIARLLEECLSDPEVKVIVFSEWEHMLDRVRRWLVESNISYAWHTGSVPQARRRNEIMAFRTDPDCRVFLSTDSGGVGLNLQCASVVINCDLPWNPAKLEQRIARAWRKNQLRAVTVVNFIAEDSIEHGMLATLAAKRDLSEGLLDGIGDLGKVTMRRGADAMLTRLQQVLSPAPPPARDLPPARVMPPADPSAAFAKESQTRLGSALTALNEVFLPDSSTVLLAVVKDDAKTHATRLRADLDKAAWRDQKPEVEVLTEADFALLQRLAKLGVVTLNQRAVRRLLAEDNIAPEPLSAEDRALADALRDKARRKARAARTMAAESLIEEAAATLISGALQLARAWAVEQRWKEPAGFDEALSGPYITLWGGSLAGLKTLTGDLTQECFPVLCADIETKSTANK